MRLDGSGLIGHRTDDNAPEAITACVRQWSHVVIVISGSLKRYLPLQANIAAGHRGVRLVTAVLRTKQKSIRQFGYGQPTIDLMSAKVSQRAEPPVTLTVHKQIDREHISWQ